MTRPPADRVSTATVRGPQAGDAGAAGQNAVTVRADARIGATIVAVAGGRGPVRGSRSNIGARIAADVAATKAEAAVSALPSTDALSLASLGDVLAARIVEQWQAQVHDHVAAQPAEDDEAIAHLAGNVPDSGDATDPLRAYGTGLLLAIVTPAAVLAMQLGDGDIVLCTDDGDTLMPVAAGATDASDGSGGTASLATEDAQSQFRHSAVDRTARDVALVLVAGGVDVDAATADPDWQATMAADLVTQADRDGIDAVDEQLATRLAAVPRSDDDDATVAVVFPAAAAPPAAVPAADVTDPRLAATIANPALGATAATPALATSTLPAVTTARAHRRRRRWIAGGVVAGVIALAIGVVLALSNDSGNTTPDTKVTPTPTTLAATPTTARTPTSTSPATSAAPPTAPTTAPATAPPTTLPAVVTVPPTVAPPRTTTPTHPPRTTTVPPRTTTVPVTASTPPTTT